MSGPVPDPERLDALLDGRAAPADAAERDLLALAAEVRAGAPPAPEAVRERVRALSAPPARRSSPRLRMPRSRWGRAALALAPACAVVAAIAVVALRGGGEASPPRAARTGAPPALEAGPAAPAAAADDSAGARAAIVRLGGVVVRDGRDGAGRGVLVARFPAGRVATARTALARRGTVATRPGAPRVLVLTVRG